MYQTRPSYQRNDRSSTPSMIVSPGSTQTPQSSYSKLGSEPNARGTFAGLTTPRMSPNTAELARQMPTTFCGAAGPPLFFTTALLLLVFAVCIGSWTQSQGTFLNREADIHFGLVSLVFDIDGTIYEFEYDELYDRCKEFEINCQKILELAETTYIVLAFVFTAISTNFLSIVSLYASYRVTIHPRIQDILVVLSIVGSLVAWLLWILVAHPLCQDIASSFLGDVKSHPEIFSSFGPAVLASLFNTIGFGITYFYQDVTYEYN